MARELVVQGDLNRDLAHDGDVTIEKNVLPGRKVSVEGNLSIGGDVRDSILEVRGRLTVGGSILFSTVHSKETVEAAFSIEGGEVLARHSVRAGRIGAPAGPATRVGAGIDFKLIDVLKDMEREIAEMAEKASKIRAAVEALEHKEKTYNKIPYQEKKLIAESRPSLDILERQLQGLQNSKKKVERALSKTLGAFVEVSDRVFPNTHLSVRNRIVATQRELPAGKYTLRDGKICRIA